MTRSSTQSRRSFAAGIAVLAALAVGGCGLPGTSDWRSQARCQPPGGGWGPEHVLPDRDKCPEAYVGNGKGGWSPSLPAGGSSEPWEPAPTPPCSRSESLNGFRCENTDPYGNPGPYYP
ncbi:MAG TPA: hypothetical protein VLI04_15275 [Nocardioidaceae bacterium]|nr:hypothetical protein [Nocardioidaceae bacterium]